MIVVVVPDKQFEEFANGARREMGLDGLGHPLVNSKASIGQTRVFVRDDNWSISCNEATLSLLLALGWEYEFMICREGIIP